MKEFPPGWVAIFERRLDHAKVPQALRPGYYKWVRFYLYFCHKFAYPPTAPTALGPFLTKLADTRHSIDDRHHAATAVHLLLRYDPQDQNLYLQLSEPCPPPAASNTNVPLSGMPQGDPSERSFSSAPHVATSWEREYRELETEIKLRKLKQP